jgi:hypothetical protein
MTVEVNIVYREKPAAVVVPAEAVANNAVQVVNSGKIQRVPVTVGIRGTRNVEIAGGVSRDTTVLSPARVDLADGTRVSVDTAKSARQTRDVPTDAAPASNPASEREPAAVVVSSADADNVVISAAISARVDSVVNDARRNVGKLAR